MGFSPAVRFAALGLILLCAVGLVWRGVVIYQADQRAQRAAAGLAEGMQNAGAEAAAPSGQEPPVALPPPAKRQLVVHVEGAVKQPGVYIFEEGARVNDAILAAGGATPEGVPGALNLAALLADGSKLYVYTRAELQPAAPVTPVAREASYAPVTTVSKAESGGSRAIAVNLNTATAAELEAVPGIGPATARAIIEYRTKHGAFKGLEELTAVSGIGPKTLEKLRPYLRV